MRHITCKKRIEYIRKCLVKHTVSNVPDIPWISVDATIGVLIDDRSAVFELAGSAHGR